MSQNTTSMSQNTSQSRASNRSQPSNENEPVYLPTLQPIEPRQLEPLKTLEDKRRMEQFNPESAAQRPPALTPTPPSNRVQVPTHPSPQSDFVPRYPAQVFAEQVHEAPSTRDFTWMPTPIGSSPVANTSSHENSSTQRHPRWTAEEDICLLETINEYDSGRYGVAIPWEKVADSLNKKREGTGITRTWKAVQIEHSHVVRRGQTIDTLRQEIESSAASPLFPADGMMHAGAGTTPTHILPAMPSASESPTVFNMSGSGRQTWAPPYTWHLDDDRQLLEAVEEWQAGKLVGTKVQWGEIVEMYYQRYGITTTSKALREEYTKIHQRGESIESITLRIESSQ